MSDVVPGRAGYGAVSDEDLLVMAGGGRVEAFEELVKRHEGAVINYFHRLHWDRHRAEDQAQEVFIRIYTHARDYAPTARFTTYMYRIAHNYWVDEVRRAVREKGTVSLEAGDEEGTPLRDLVSDGSDGPRDRARKDEVVDAVIGAIDALPDEQKAVFVLSEVKGMKYAHIAEALDIPEGTVKSRMHAAVRRLRKRLTTIAPRGR